jgi:uncharacterized protein (DUF1015 family)
MVEVRPFRGIRFNLSKVRKLGDVVAQPYDKITDEMREGYYSKSDCNVVRMTKGKPNPGDSPKDNVYTRAKGYLDKWLKEKVLVQDAKPSLYVYQQEFEAPGVGKKTRKGFICTIRLVPFEAGIVLPHEKTLSKPKEDRLNLLRAIKANTGQIFILYPDEKNAVYSLLEPFAKGKPEMEAMEEGTVRHRVWSVTDPKVIAKVKDAMKDKVLFIADGHHRYETSLDYMDERKAAGKSHTGDEPYDFVMTTMVSMEDPGLVILPTHRLVHNLKGFDLEKFLKKCSDYFNLKPTQGLSGTLAEMKKSTGHAFGVYAGGKYMVMTAKKGSGWEKLLPSDRSPDFKKLDVVVLHLVVIQDSLGISEEKVRTQENIKYVRDPEDGVKAVDSGEAEMLLLMNPTKVSQVKAIASGREKMPQKSTDFFPKMITGLVLNPLE